MPDPTTPTLADDGTAIAASASTLAPEDFYLHGELLVFTEAYHRKRGYCCGSGCRHCPFGRQALPAGERAAPASAS